MGLSQLPSWDELAEQAGRGEENLRAFDVLVSGLLGLDHLMEQEPKFRINLKQNETEIIKMKRK